LGGAEQLNPWQLVVGASPVVQFVLLILIFMMVMCLYIIGAKWIRLKQVTDQSRAFLNFSGPRKRLAFGTPRR